MNCFVTGASGFIGANLVHELAARQHRVKALLRPGCDLRGLAGAEFERLEGDLSEVVATAVEAWSTVGAHLSHVVTHLTLSVGSPTVEA